MASIGNKTRYIQSITARDDTHDTLSLTDSDPVGTPPPPGIISAVDSLVVTKPHSYVTGQSITLDYSVA